MTQLADVIDDENPAGLLVEFAPAESGIGLDIKIDGQVVPHITAFRREDGTLSLTLDRRFGLETPADDEGWLWFLAQAMAVAAGFTSHGPNSAIRNPHGPPVVGIGRQ